jgi:hypothetical protein
MMMAMRFVPFATDASRPRKMSAGRPRDEPPPAVTFKKPAAMPTTKSRRYCQSWSMVRS